MKIFVLLLVLLATVFGQLPSAPALPSGSFAVTNDEQYHTIAAQSIATPMTSYLLIQCTSNTAGVTFKASQGCFPGFPFLNANDESDAECTVVSNGGSCFLQIQPGIVQSNVDTYLLIENGNGAMVSVSSTVETISPQALAETLDQSISGTLIPGGISLHGPVFVSAGGGYSSVGAPNHIGVILTSANNFEVSVSFESTNTENSTDSCFTNGGTCFTSSSDTCGIDILASGNWYIVVRDISGNGGSYSGFLEFRVLPTDPDFQAPLLIGSGGVSTRSTQLNTLADQGTSFELLFTLNDPNDMLSVFVSNTLLASAPCSIASCQSSNGVCRIVVDRCQPGPFAISATAINSAMGANTVSYTSSIRTLSNTAVSGTFGVNVNIDGVAETIVTIPSAASNGAFVVSTPTPVSQATVTRGSAVAQGSFCSNVASQSTTGLNTVFPGCVGGSTGDFFFQVDTTATTFTVTNVTPNSATSGAPITGTLAIGSAVTYSLSYDGIPTVVSIQDNSAGGQLFSISSPSDARCEADSQTGNSANVAVCSPSSATSSSILIGVHSFTGGNTAVNFVPTVQSSVSLTAGTSSNADFTVRDTYVFVLGSATSNAAAYVEIDGFTQPIFATLSADCDSIASAFCETAPCRVIFRDSALAGNGRLSVELRSTGSTDNAVAVSFRSGTDTCSSNPGSPCSGEVSGSVSVAALPQRASDDIAQFQLNGACDATSFVCSYQYPACDGNGFTTLPSYNECVEQFASCGFQCFNACDGLEINNDDSSASLIQISFGLLFFIFTLF